MLCWSILQMIFTKTDQWRKYVFWCVQKEMKIFCAFYGVFLWLYKVSLSVIDRNVFHLAAKYFGSHTTVIAWYLYHSDGMILFLFCFCMIYNSDCIILFCTVFLHSTAMQFRWSGLSAAVVFLLLAFIFFFSVIHFFFFFFFFSPFVTQGGRLFGKICA